MLFSFVVIDSLFRQYTPQVSDIADKMTSKGGKKDER